MFWIRMRYKYSKYVIRSISFGLSPVLTRQFPALSTEWRQHIVLTKPFPGLFPSLVTRLLYLGSCSLFSYTAEEWLARIGSRGFAVCCVCKECVCCAHALDWRVRRLAWLERPGYVPPPTWAKPCSGLPSPRCIRASDVNNPIILCVLCDSDFS